MTKIPEAEARLFKNIFVCKKCKTKIRADPSKIRAEKIKCRGCNGKSFRPIKKK